MYSSRALPQCASKFLRGTTVWGTGPPNCPSPIVPIATKVTPVPEPCKSLLPWGPITSSASIRPLVPARYAHSDITVPNFDEYRHSNTMETDRHSNDLGRKATTYIILGGGGVTTAYGTKSLVTQFVATMAPSADVLALAQIEVDLTSIPEGKNAIFKWQGKPLFVRHRTQDEIDDVRSTDITVLRHREHDHDRVVYPKWLVVIGVCTHLGCVPISNAGDYGGYFCPCHGSHYDASGRVRKGPAPENLPVPKHEFSSDDLLIVG